MVIPLPTFIGTHPYEAPLLISTPTCSQFQRSSHNHRQRASIIPVTKTIRSYPITWTSCTVLDDATTFFLNPYLRYAYYDE